jgi:hypothetical protein
MVRRTIVLLVCLLATLGFAASAQANWQYYQNKGASPHVFNQTSATYTNGFHWARNTGGAYTWWVFTAGGTFVAGAVPGGGLGTWDQTGYNNFYWKFRNDGNAVVNFDIYKKVP